MMHISGDGIGQMMVDDRYWMMKVVGCHQLSVDIMADIRKQYQKLKNTFLKKTKIVSQKIEKGFSYIFHKLSKILNTKKIMIFGK